MFMYAPVSSLNLLSSMAYVCVCLHLLSSVCVYKCVCAASARHSSLTLAAVQDLMCEPLSQPASSYQPR